MIPEEAFPTQARGKDTSGKGASSNLYIICFRPERLVDAMGF
jgi:hypothetical protein